jgi:uncharacterized membrane protein
MLLGLLIVLGTHVFTTMRPQRAAVIARIGEWPYRVVYSLISLAGLALVIWGYVDWRGDGPAELWYPSPWTRHLALTLMIPACIALAATWIPSYLRSWLRRPAFVAIAIWAIAHLFANGDAPTVVLALAILTWVSYAVFSMRRREAVTRAEPKGWIGDAAVVLAGLVIYAALAYVFHPYVIGVPIL